MNGVQTKIMKKQPLETFPIFLYFPIRFLTIWIAKIVKTDIMTIKELAAYLKMAEKTLYRLAAGGEIPGFKVGGAWRFRKGEVDKWIVRQEKHGRKNKGLGKIKA